MYDENYDPKNKGLNTKPIVQKATKRCSVRLPLVVNIISGVVLGVSMLCFILSLIFFKQLKFDEFYKELYYTVITFLAVSCLCFIFHIIYLIFKKRILRKIDVITISAYIISILTIAILQLSIASIVDSKIYKYWNNKNNYQKVEDIEKSLKCCGYSIYDQKCYKTQYKTSCRNSIINKMRSQQLPIACVQIVSGLILFAFLIILMYRQLHKKNRTHSRSHKLGNKRDNNDNGLVEAELRELPLNPEAL